MLSATARAQILPDGFAVQDVVTGPFQIWPAGFAFLPDGRVLITEGLGNVRLGTVGSPTAHLIATIPDVRAGGDRGLLGIAVDPAWPARPYLYFHSTRTDSTIRLTMYTVSGDLTNPTSANLTLTNPYEFFLDIRDANFHKGGTLRFGPDGDLYMSIGDNGGFCTVQDLTSYNGKILRLDVSRMPGSGSGPPPKADLTPADNPFPGPDPVARLVYASGFRNPYRFTIDPWTNDLYILDVGEAAWEEVDTIVHAGYTGANFGWPTYEGFVATNCCPECTFHPPFTTPIYVYPNPPSTGAAGVGGPLYHRVEGAPASFPFQYDGSLFVSDYYGGWIRRLLPGVSGWTEAPAVPGQLDPVNWVTGIPTIVDLQAGPDGGLYFITMFATASGLPQGLHRIVNTTTTSADNLPARRFAFAVPNPAAASAGTRISYGLPRPAAVRLGIYDLAGRLVRTLHGAPASTGTLPWDGRTERGVQAAAGVYMFHLTTDTGNELRGKISLLR